MFVIQPDFVYNMEEQSYVNVIWTLFITFI